MSEKVNSEYFTGSLHPQQHPIEPTSVESSAVQLMHELFQDFEPHLREENFSTPVAATPQLDVAQLSLDTQVTSLVTATQEQRVSWGCLPEDLKPFIHTTSITLTTQSATLVPATPTATALSVPEAEMTPWIKVADSESNQHRFFFGFVCSSLAFTVVLWVASQFLKPQAPAVVAVPQAVQPLQVSAVDMEFAAYMQRSLALIQKSAPAPQAPPATVTALSQAPQSGDQTITVKPDAIKTASQPPANVVAERIYIPVYQPQPPAPIPSAAEAKVPVVGLSNVAAQPTKPAPITPLAPKAQSMQKLVGVLELGDRSVALVASNGVTQRIGLNEVIDANGWQLVEIADQKAVIQRGGELRSIYVGQKF